MEITKDVELEAAAQAAAGVEPGKKPQKGAADSALKKKPQSVAAGKSTDKQAAVVRIESSRDIQRMSSFTYFQTTKAAPLDTSTTKSLSEWAVFVPADDLLQTFNLSLAKQRGFNKHTISNR